MLSVGPLLGAKRTLSMFENFGKFFYKNFLDAIPRSSSREIRYGTQGTQGHRGAIRGSKQRHREGRLRCASAAAGSPQDWCCA